MRLGMRAHKNIITSDLGIDSMLPPGSEAKDDRNMHAMGNMRNKGMNVQCLKTERESQMNVCISD